ncbi:serine protease [Staphylococcus sp. SQ8-PEA]|uniref:Serine protease n=1 Tax=Staphylococcus marylandisciuri TaxID=2981529 RepID=A0ABT2QN56_9STAP|nr:serine protease [Staphylococcus marylandisciuri]MCU5745389.1 serine protease [Staphylococcus marylandisciuri]
MKINKIFSSFAITLACIVGISLPNASAASTTQQDQTSKASTTNNQTTNSPKVSNHIQNRIILPNNDRHRITNTTSGHYQSLCYVVMADGHIATGVVVGKNTLLTNKHVVRAGQIKAMPGANGENNYPKGQFKSNKIVKYSGKQDLAVVHFNKNKQGQSIGDVVQPATIGDSAQSNKGDKVTITGYPADKPVATMWESFGKLTKNNNDQLQYNASTYGGNSGSAVFNKQNQVIGIHFGGASKTANGAVPLTGNTLQFVKNNIQ